MWASPCYASVRLQQRRNNKNKKSRKPTVELFGSVWKAETSHLGQGRGHMLATNNPRN